MIEIILFACAGAALVGWQRAHHWHLSYRKALELYRSLPKTPAKTPAKTPHQRGAETRKQREMERLRRHREAMQRSIEEALRG